MTKKYRPAGEAKEKKLINKKSMIAKKLRLSGRDVAYIIRKGKRFFTTHFSVTSIPQYPNRKHHQIGVQIGVAYSKSAVKRNALRRKIYDSINRIDIPIHNGFYKFFIILNKKSLAEIASLSNLDILSREKIINNQILLGMKYQGKSDTK